MLGYALNLWLYLYEEEEGLAPPSGGGGGGYVPTYYILGF